MLTSYKHAIKELTRKLRKELGTKLRSVVLYGSVARGDATEDSDIDILLVIESNDLFEKASKISYDVDLENRVLTAIFWVTPQKLEKYVERGSPFIENVAEEGEILYDDGTFERIRSRVIKAGRAVPTSS